MADGTKTLALSACDDALKISVANIGSVLLNGLISAKSEKARNDAKEKARKGVQLTKEAHGAMLEIVDSVFT
jgi:hypothetical protein